MAVALLAAGLLVGTHDLGGQDPPEPVSGRVLDAGSGEPIPGAYVELLATGHGVYTDDSGDFEFPRSRLGDGGAMIRARGYQRLALGQGSLRTGVRLTVRLAPDPIQLEEIRVVRDRFADRRRRSPWPARVYDETALHASPGTALEFVYQRAHRLSRTCPGGEPDGFLASTGGICLRLGRDSAPPNVIIDEHPRFWTVDMLASMDTREIGLVEVFGGGRYVRVYTREFMDRITRNPESFVLLPLFHSIR